MILDNSTSVSDSLHRRKRGKNVEQLYHELYVQMNAYMEKHPRYKEHGLSLHVPMKGSRYDALQPVRLMWIGRAINGWDDAAFFTLPIDDFSEKVKCLEQCHTRFDWLKSYNYRHSPFWRTCKLLHQKLYRAENAVEDWYEDIIWTNLYNVAPANGGNPSGALCKAQQAINVQLLQQQITTFAPTHIVFVTDTDWFFDFAAAGTHLFPDVVAIPDAVGAVVAAGTIDNSKVVVTKRPEYRFSDEAFTSSIIEAFQKISNPE